MFPLIGSFVKERRGPVLLWQWLITIISCLSIFDKPSLTQQHGCLSAFVHSVSTSPFTLISPTTGLLRFSLRIHGYAYSFCNRHFVLKSDKHVSSDTSSQSTSRQSFQCLVFADPLSFGNYYKVWSYEGHSTQPAGICACHTFWAIRSWEFPDERTPHCYWPPLLSCIGITRVSTLWVQNMFLEHFSCPKKAPLYVIKRNCWLVF